MSNADDFREQRAERLTGGTPRKPARRGDIRLRAASGVIIDHTLPLHGAIDDQWRKGELKRVDDDGMPWTGDEYDLASAWDRRARDGEDDPGDDAGDSTDDYSVPGGDGEPDGNAEDSGSGSDSGSAAAVTEPVRPADTAPKKAWQDYAVAISAATPDEAAGMTRNDLIARCTPPELLPDAARQ